MLPTVTYTLPAGTVVPGGGYLVISRASNKASFEAFWGVTLGSNVVFRQPADADVSDGLEGQFVIFNGSTRNYSLRAGGSGSAVLDGPTISIADNTVRMRNVPVTASNSGTSWGTASAVPGAANGATPGGGQSTSAIATDRCYFSELASSESIDITNESIFEFIEIHCP
jgi:hypothetical protein